MKKILMVIPIVALAGLAIWGGAFYWNNLRGIGPAINPPPADITELIPSEQGGPQPDSQTQTQVDGQTAVPANTTEMPLTLPPGLGISIFASGLKGPRVMVRDPVGNLVVSLTGDGKVVALSDKNGDGKAEEAVTVAEGLNKPHGLAFYCPTPDEKCRLYIAETDQVATYDFDYETLKASNKKKIMDLPGAGGHYTRTIMFLPAPLGDKFLVSVGSSCNVCNESDDRRAKILIADADGSNVRDYASGLRNSVFMAIHPVDGKVWATEMGRDQLGDDIPPDEINIIEDGKKYGWPICYGQNIHDGVFDKNKYIRNPCMEPFETPSYIDLQAHSAPLGLAFIPEEGWPEDWWYNLLVSYHGSWNRSVPTGYKIDRYKLDAQGKVLGREDFISGWLTKEGALGRPVDIMVEPGGKIYISDDKAGVIYLVLRSA